LYLPLGITKALKWIFPSYFLLEAETKGPAPPAGVREDLS